LRERSVGRRVLIFFAAGSLALVADLIYIFATFGCETCSYSTFRLLLNEILFVGAILLFVLLVVTSIAYAISRLRHERSKWQ